MAYVLDKEITDEVAELKEYIPDSTLSPFRPWQLWFIYLGLTRLDLSKELKEGTDSLAKTIRDYGEREWGWLKDEEENYPFRGNKSMKPQNQKQVR